MPAFFAQVAVRPASMAAAVDPRPPESRIEAEVRRARGLIEKRQFTQALTPGPDPWIISTGAPEPTSWKLVAMPPASTVWAISALDADTEVIT